MTCNLCGGPVDPVRDQRWVKDGYPILECRACRLVFRRDLPTPDELAEIYGEAYFCRDRGDTSGQGYADYLGDEELHRLNARRRLRTLERYREPGRLLDVGAAAGFFVDEARRRGWDARGIDVSPEMARWATERLGVDVELGTLSDASLEDGSYEAVTMWDYIEHSSDPAADVARSGELLMRGGLLALSTGDVESPVARLSGSRWHLLTPRHHNYFFSARTLRLLLRRAGLEVVSVGYPASAYSLRYLAYKLRTLADRPLVRQAGERLERSRAGRLRLPLNLWDIVTIVARKP